jgi:hypothetical protein
MVAVSKLWPLEVLKNYTRRPLEEELVFFVSGTGSVTMCAAKTEALLLLL